MSVALKEIYKHHEKRIHLIQNATKPLSELLGIPYFSYQKIDAKGDYSVFCNNLEFADFYLENKFYMLDPYLVAPSQYNDGTSIHIVSKELHELDHGIAKIYDGTLKKFHFGESIIFIIKDGDTYEIFIFSLPNNKDALLKTALNKIDLLERFISHFKKSNAKLLTEVDDIQVNIAEIRGDDFNLHRPNYHLINQDLRNTYLEAISPEEHMLRLRIKDLTIRERECLYWTVGGKTASETAEILNISRRTVETYREKVKDKLGPHYTISNLCYLIGKYGLI